MKARTPYLTAKMMSSSLLRSGTRKDLIEIRANTFASFYLLPPSVILKLPVTSWDRTEIVRWASKLHVNTTALAIALKENNLIDKAAFDHLRRVGIRCREEKVDPELAGLAARSLERKRQLLERGLSSSYVALCFDAIFEKSYNNFQSRRDAPRSAGRPPGASSVVRGKAQLIND